MFITIVTKCYYTCDLYYICAFNTGTILQAVNRVHDEQGIGESNCFPFLINMVRVRIRS